MFLRCKGIVLALFLPLLSLTSCFGNEKESEETVVTATVESKEKESEETIVNATVESIDNCYHWGGETGDQSEERNAQIMDGINRDCPEAERIAIKAYGSYPNNLVLSANLLKLIDFGYFKVTDEQKINICGTAIPFFKKNFLESEKIDFLYRYVCPKHATELYGN